MIQSVHKKDVTNVAPFYGKERQNCDIKMGISEKRKHTKK